MPRLLCQQLCGSGPVADRHGRFFEHQVDPIDSQAGLDLASCWIEEQLFTSTKHLCRQPRSVDGRDEPRPCFAARIVDIDRQE